MIKITGVLLIVTGSVLLGMMGKLRLKTRIKTLAGLCDALDIMHSEILFLCTPLDEIFLKLKKNSGPPLDEFFSRCCQWFESESGVPFNKAFRRVLREAAYLNLRAREIDLLASLGNSLGRYSAEEQTKKIVFTRGQLALHLSKTEGDLEKNGKLYTGMSIICGVAIAVIFI